MAITALPALDRTDAGFREDVDLFFGTQLPLFSVQAEAARIEINSNTLTASNAAISADADAISAAANAAIAAEAAIALGSFLGTKTSDPTLDNQGNSLQNGDFYVNSVSGFIRAYTTATGWVQGISAVAGVSSLNTLTGALTLKTLNGEVLTGSGNILTFSLAQIQAISLSL